MFYLELNQSTTKQESSFILTERNTKLTKIDTNDYKLK